MQRSNSGAKTSTHHRWRVHLSISQHRRGCSTWREGRTLLGRTVTGHILLLKGVQPFCAKQPVIPQVHVWDTRERETESVWGACHTDRTWNFHPTHLLSLWWHGTISTGCLQPPCSQTSWEERSPLSENRIVDQVHAQIFSAEISHQMHKRFVIHLQEAENWHYLHWSASLTKLECMVLPVILCTTV